MNLEDLNLEFLWLVNGNPYSAPEVPARPGPWDKDIQAHEQFIRESEFEQLIQLMVISYKDRYPRDYWMFALLISQESLFHMEVDGLCHSITGEHLHRKEISRYQARFRNDLHGELYFFERILDLQGSFDLVPAVLSALGETPYSLAESDMGTLIVVRDSPIGEIELGPSYFRLTINEKNCEFLNTVPLTLEDLNLEFLWAERGGPIMDAPDPFWEKWHSEWWKYTYFIKYAPLVEVVGLLIISFRDRYPRDYWKGALTSLGNPTDDELPLPTEKTENSSATNRDDILRYAWRSRKDIHGFQYDHERTFEFRDPIDLSSTVEDLLTKMDYKKQIMGSKTVYQMKNSPIARMELKKNSFKLITSSEYAIRKRPRS